MPLLTVPVRHVADATPRTRLINLDLSATAFSFRAGQAVMVGLHGSPLRKPYSIASAPFELANTGTLQLLTQVDESGGPDPHLELAAPGTRLDVEGPFGSFGLPTDTKVGLLFVAGGTGIAPLRSMLLDHLSQGPTAAMALVYSARSADEFAFRADLDAIQATGRVAVHFTVTRDEGRRWDGRRGRIDEDLLRNALPSPESVALICGPPQLVNDTCTLLRKLGVSDERILLEKY